MGARGCTMDDFRKELLRGIELPAKSGARREHAPLITLDLTRILGCTCGWRTPLEATDSDVTYTVHATIARVAEELP